MPGATLLQIIRHLKTSFTKINDEIPSSHTGHLQSLYIIFIYFSIYSVVVVKDSFWLQKCKPSLFIVLQIGDQGPRLWLDKLCHFHNTVRGACQLFNAFHKGYSPPPPCGDLEWLDLAPRPYIDRQKYNYGSGWFSRKCAPVVGRMSLEMFLPVFVCLPCRSS